MQACHPAVVDVVVQSTKGDRNADGDEENDIGSKESRDKEDPVKGQNEREYFPEDHEG